MPHVVHEVYPGDKRLTTEARPRGHGGVHAMTATLVVQYLTRRLWARI